MAITLYERFGMLMDNLLPTAIEAICGFALGNIAAISLATVFVYRKTTEEASFPIAVMIKTIPVVAKAPILVLLLGNGMEPKIAIAALIIQATYNLDLPLLYATIAVGSVFSASFFGVISVIERWALRWNVNAEA